MERRIVVVSIVLMVTIALVIGPCSVHVYSASSGVSVDEYKVTLLPQTMPLSLCDGSATWDGASAYVFGGGTDGHTSGVIVKFDPETDSATALLDNLPCPRSATAAVYVKGPVFDLDNVSYIFGGGGEWYGCSGEVVRFFGEWYPGEWYDVHYGLNGGLSPGEWGMSAVWNGTRAFLFGGLGTNGSIEAPYSDTILEYTLLGPTIAVAKLPHAMGYTSAIWDGKNAYIFGGEYSNLSQIQYYNSIVRFNPDTNEVTTMNATLPTGRAFTSAVWDGRYAYVFGGQTSEADLNDILRYDPSTDTLQVLPVKLPFNTEGSVAVWNGSVAYIFGGDDIFGEGNPGNQIVMLSNIPASSSSLGLNPALVYVPLVVVALVASTLYVFARRRKHKLEQSQESDLKA